MVITKGLRNYIMQHTKNYGNVIHNLSNFWVLNIQMTLKIGICLWFSSYGRYLIRTSHHPANEWSTRCLGWVWLQFQLHSQYHSDPCTWSINVIIFVYLWSRRSSCGCLTVVLRVLHVCCSWWYTPFSKPLFRYGARWLTKKVTL